MRISASSVEQSSEPYLSGAYPCVVAHVEGPGAGALTALVDAHHEVQPPGRLEHWRTPPATQAPMAKASRVVRWHTSRPQSIKAARGEIAEDGGIEVPRMTEQDGLAFAYRLDAQGGDQPVGWNGIRARRPHGGRLWMHRSCEGTAAQRWISGKSEFDPVIAKALTEQETLRSEESAELRRLRWL